MCPSFLIKPPDGGGPLNSVAAISLSALVQRLRDGDGNALEPLIAATRGMASRLAYSILHDRDLCQDVVQDVYITVYQKIHQLREVAAFKGWFTRIIVNRCRAELKHQPQLLEDHEEEVARMAASAEPLDEQLEVRQALESLSQLDRTVLTMREVMDLSYQEIAETLEIPVGTVRSRIFNARQRLLSTIQKGRQN